MTTDNSTLRKLWEKSLWQVGYYWDKAVPSSFYPEFLQMFSTSLGQIVPPKQSLEHQQCQQIRRVALNRISKLD